MTLISYSGIFGFAKNHYYHDYYHSHYLHHYHYHDHNYYYYHHYHHKYHFYYHQYHYLHHNYNYFIICFRFYKISLVGITSNFCDRCPPTLNFFFGGSLWKPIQKNPLFFNSITREFAHIS